MAVKTLTCPNCQAPLTVDGNSNVFRCNYCNASLQYSDADQVIKVVIEGIATRDQRLILAEQLMESRNFEEADKAFKELIKVDPENHQAWWGVFRCEMAFAEYYRKLYNWSKYSYEWANMLSDIITQYANVAIKYAPSDIADEYRKRIADDIKLIKEISSGKYNTQKDSGSAFDGCYIASAVYGSYYEPQVLVLRRYRDNVLKKKALGRAFIRFYYRISPSLADKMNPNSVSSIFVRRILNRFVSKIEKKEHM